jgi:hypothetical protein
MSEKRDTTIGRRLPDQPMLPERTRRGALTAIGALVAVILVFGSSFGILAYFFY